MEEQQASAGSHACPICANGEGNRVHRVAELQFGTQESFRYLECAGCGCLSLMDVPDDWGRYYPDDYYSFSAPRNRQQNGFVTRMRRQRSDALLGRGSPVGRFLARFSKRPPYFDYLENLGLSTDSRIVDIGCGAGKLIYRMSRDGFGQVTGIDPHLAGDVTYDSGLVVRKAAIEDLDGQFDFAMLHHSFEHMSDPRGALATVASHVRQGGHILLRVPVAGCFAWRRYGPAWVSLDAPRHVFIHSVGSIGILAKELGLTPVRTFYDSGSRQFYGSELFLRRLSLVEHQGRLLEHFTAEELEAFQAEAERLNRLRDGDTIGIILRQDRSHG
ncbi:MAG TPA: class I SAM-dependent methyltransferase [Rhodocyclaceae bacterium]|nr:class I SAM-dependent methyltransferase [Rhodocyclaceae bacterium]